MKNPCCSNQVSSKIMVSVDAIFEECNNLNTLAQLNWNGSGWVGSQSAGYNFDIKCHGFDSFGVPVFQLDWSLPNCGGQELLSSSAQCTPALLISYGSTGVSSEDCCAEPNPPTTGLVMSAYESIPVPDALPPVSPPCDPEFQCCSSSPSGTSPSNDSGRNGAGGGPGRGGASDGPGNGASASKSDAPVRYGTGEFDYSVSDLSVDGYGLPWGHTRSFRSRLSHSETIGQGYNWQVQEWPFLVQGPTGLVGTEITQVVIQGTSNSSFWFDKVEGEWVPRLNIKWSLEHDTTNKVYRLTDLKGSVTEFDDFTGMFTRKVSPAGNTITVTGMSSNGANFTTVEREYTENSVTTTEKFEYAYQNEGDLLLSSMTLSRKVGAGSWENVSRVLYTYYGENEAYGLQEDLKTAVTEQWDGSDWQNTGTNYYRYYKNLTSGSSSSSSSSSSAGQAFVHELKYILNKEAYNKLAADPNVSDPLTATDVQVAQYADYYFEFDELHRVTKEMIQGGSRTYSFNYVESGFDDDYNAWKTKTTETLPDGSQNIVYSNYASQPMLKILKSGDDEWYEFFKYDSSANIILNASSSAISGYDDQYADLLHELNGNYQYLRDTTGLIRTYTYHAPTNWLASSSIQEGELGTSIKLLELEYIACGGGSSSSSSSSSASQTAYFLSKETSYPSDTDQTKKIITSYAYTWYEGTCQVKEKTTTLPVILTSQNGSGVANTLKEYFDEYGYLTWTMDERGYINQNIYDIPTGAITQQIQDVDTGEATGVPAGWVTPSGGGFNLITDFEHDDRGRIIQSLGPVHTIDLAGVATDVRTANWFVYKSAAAENQLWQAQGYATGTAPSYTYTLINPVTIDKLDKNENFLESIQATRASTSGKLQPTDTFAQSSYVSWETNQYTECCLLESTRVYHTIPTSGAGSSGINYDQTDFGYDSMKRPNRTTTPGGTISFDVFDVRGNVIKSFIGTDDTGATNQDPTGGGAVGNNMVQVVGLEYDGGTAGGDNNLTQQTDYASASDTRITSFTYDWRNRNIDTDGEIDFFQKLYYDNLDRVTKTEQYDTTIAGNLISRSETKFDDLGRVYQTIRYGVDPSTGTVGNRLTDNIWHDAVGNVIKELPAGSDLFAKNAYDSLGRLTAQYLGYDLDETSYSEIGEITGDTILEQTETIYDDASNVIKSIARMRYHDAPASQTGALQDPSTTPKARVTYSAFYPDGMGRTIAFADYGTNGGTTLSRSNTIPNRSDSILMTTTAFDVAGRPSQLIGPDEMELRKEYDAAGREVKLIENYQESSSSSSGNSSSCIPSDDTNQTTTRTFTPDGAIATLTAENSVTGNQVTIYTYGTTLSDSEVATSFLLQKETYPDSTDANDVIKYAYNRLAQIIKRTDQLETVHEINYDKLGRVTQDRVTTLGTGVDGAVRRLGLTYNSRNLISDIMSYDNAVVGQGTVVNAVQLAYNDFGQGITSYQSHAGVVNVNSTPKVQFGFANGSDNTVRPDSLTYPDGRALTLNYGSAGSIDDATSRVFAIVNDDVSSTHLAEYSYLGLGSPVIADDTEPEVRFTLVGTAGGNDPNTGDIYRGLDRFGRIKDSLWYDYGASASNANIQYGYDRASNRTYRDNPLDTTNSFDEFYTYDGLQRLKETERGALNVPKTGISTLKFAQCWSLDETGNWKGFQQDDTGNGTWNLQQTRTSNKVNEITDITETAGSSWITPAYSKGGNMTTIPQPADPTTSFTATYDAWNRLVKITDGSNTISEYEFDGRNFRIVQKSYSSGVLSKTRHFYFTNSWREIEERIDSETSPERQLVWGLRYLDDLVLRDRDTTGNGILDERLYALQDDNWNVTAICNENGDVQERYAYDSYGAPIFLTPSFGSRSSSSFDWETLYAGYHWETASELFHVRNRVYHSAIGTWLQRDKLGYLDGGNLYVYVSDNPLSLLDTYGNQGAGATAGRVSSAIYEPRVAFDNAVKDALKKKGIYKFPGKGKRAFDACFSALCVRNSLLAGNRDARREIGEGCQGVTSLMLGVNLASGDPSAKNLSCYDSLANAKKAQKNMKCSGKNNKRAPAGSGIFAYRWGNPELNESFKTDSSGKVIWNKKGDARTGPGGRVHDFGYYDPIFDAFWGANFSEATPGSYPHIKKPSLFYPDADLNPSTGGGAKVYCVVCEGSKVPAPNKPILDKRYWINTMKRYRRLFGF